MHRDEVAAVPRLQRRENISVGADVEDIDRWRRLLPRIDQSKVQRLFHPEEHQYCQSFDDPAPQYAGRWCAKEAVFKALSPYVPAIHLRDIKILRDDSGRPRVVLSSTLIQQHNLKVDVSISHSGLVAFAVAIVMSDALVAEG